MATFTALAKIFCNIKSGGSIEFSIYSISMAKVIGVGTC